MQSSRNAEGALIHRKLYWNTANAFITKFLVVIGRTDNIFGNLLVIYMPLSTYKPFSPRVISWRAYSPNNGSLKHNMVRFDAVVFVDL